MAECKHCGQKSIFLRVNDEGLCAACVQSREAYRRKKAEAKQRETEAAAAREAAVRQQGVIAAQGVNTQAQSIADTANLMVSMLNQPGGFSDEDVQTAIKIAERAAAAVAALPDIVQFGELDSIMPAVQAAQTVIDTLTAQINEYLRV